MTVSRTAVVTAMGVETEGVIVQRARLIVVCQQCELDGHVVGHAVVERVGIVLGEVERTLEIVVYHGTVLVIICGGDLG